MQVQKDSARKLGLDASETDAIIKKYGLVVDQNAFVETPETTELIKLLDGVLNSAKK